MSSELIRAVKVISVSVVRVLNRFFPFCGDLGVIGYLKVLIVVCTVSSLFMKGIRFIFENAQDTFICEARLLMVFTVERRFHIISRCTEETLVGREASTSQHHVGARCLRP